jgi:DNA-binding NarL/FixJ family response regulator
MAPAVWPAPQSPECQHGATKPGSSPRPRLGPGVWGNPQDVWRLLLVDDRDSVREVLRLYADGRGLTVVGEAADGNGALAAARQHRPHAIVLDEEMPGRNGSEILPELRAELPDAVIVLYSSGRRSGVQARARAVGADAYFDKRVSPREIIGAVIDILEAVGPRLERFPRHRAAHLHPTQADTRA